MRERILGWLGWVIIGLIIITFAAFGLQSYLRDRSRVYAARINDQEIAPRQLQLAYQRQRNRVEQMMGDAFDPAKIDEAQLRRQALDALVRDELMFQAAQHDRFAVSDQYLGAYLRAVPALQENGEFSSERYQRLLFSQGLSQPAFEADVRKELEIKQWVQGFSKTAFVLPSEIKAAYNLYKQKRSFSYVTLPVVPAMGEVEVSEDEARAYYDAHVKEFETPERVRVNYLRLSRADIAGGMSVDEAAVKALYEEKKASLVKQEQRRAHHILIQVPSDAPEDEVAKARAKADEALAKLHAGESFESLAKVYSDDPGSSDAGGDLGFFGRGAMVPAFDEAVFGMEVGQISEPIRTQFGFHIIRLDEIQGADVQSFDEARPVLEAELKNREAADVFYDRLERLTNLSYENSQSLEPAANDLDLKIEESDWLTAQGGPGIGEYRVLLDAVFGPDVLDGGNNSEPVEVGDDDIVVARIKDREPAKAQPFDEVRAHVEVRIRAEKAHEQLVKKGEELLGRVRGGESLQQIADSENLKLAVADAITRDDPAHSAQIVRRAFRVPRPEGDAPRVEGFEISTGDYIVLKLDAVQDVSEATVPEADKRALETAFLSARQTGDVNAMIEYLKETAEIDIPEEAAAQQ